jgi:predicted pyridoxine 5'-phosphate oxidase superfamily flavin-nucleotide-binding protein
MNTKYHNGERHIQQLVGEEKIAARNGKIIFDKIVKGAFNFIENQQFLIISSRDENGQIWNSILMGNNGFLKIIDERNIQIHLAALQSDKGDILFKNLASNDEIGLLFIELATRRRFRVNGKAVLDGESLSIEVIEAYPNCPKYIQKRSLRHLEKNNTKAQYQKGTTLEQAELDWIRQADTFFVGSASANGGMDTSHRGGAVGFVEILTDGQLKIPDYVGNSMYNTLGNFVENPNAGLLFIDFTTGATLQLSGKAALVFGQQSEEDLQKTTGTGRYWTFKTEYWIRTEGLQVDWEFGDFSPFNP